jgi:hypothetical protein
MKVNSLPLRLENYFFSPIAPTTLALARMIIFGLVLWKSLSRAWFLIGEWPSFFLVRTAVPTLPYVTTPILGLLTVLLVVSSFLGLLGVLTRWSAAVCFAVLYLLNAVDGGAWDSDWLLFSFLLLLCTSRASNALRPTWARPSSPPADSWEYRWPLRAMQLSLLLVYFETGTAKLAASGIHWTRPEILQGWFLFHHWTDSHYFAWGSLLLDHPWLSSLAAGATLVLEVGAVVVLFIERLKWVFIPGLMLMHVLIGLTLNIWFTSYFFLLLLFFDWSRLSIPRLAPRRI